jgi:hypothetical protein
MAIEEVQSGEIQDCIDDICNTFKIECEVDSSVSAGLTGAEAALIAVTFIVTNFAGELLKEMAKDFWTKIKSLKKNIGKDKSKSYELNLKIPVNAKEKTVYILYSLDSVEDSSEVEQFFEKVTEKKEQIESDNPGNSITGYRFDNENGWQQF